MSREKSSSPLLRAAGHIRAAAHITQIYLFIHTVSVLKLFASKYSLNKPLMRREI